MRRASIALALACLALLPAGCGGGSKQPLDEGLGYMPKDTPFVVAIETDRIYLPGQAEGTADERHLGLRIFDLRVNPVSP